MIKFVVYGKPTQMGSKKAFVVPGKGGAKPRAILTDDNSDRRMQWANAVATAAAEAMNGAELIDRPVKVRVGFYFARPNAHYGTGKNSNKLKPSAPEIHGQSPDLDKLIRCLNDALTGIVFRDDRLVWHTEMWRDWTESQERAEVEVTW